MTGGEDTGFSELFDSFYKRLSIVAWRICGRVEVAEELTQEAFLRYYERRHKLPRGDEARYWLIRVVKNLAYNYERRRVKEQNIYENYGRDFPEHSESSGENEVFRDETRGEVKEALLKVPYKLRVALILREYAELPYADISRIMGITEGNVKVRVFRARKLLANILLRKEELHVSQTVHSFSIL